MKRIINFVLVLISTLVFSQKNNEIRKVIDSISKSRWDRALPNVDSLASPIFDPININFKDTIAIKDKVAIPSQIDEMPITPFLLNNFKEPKKWYFFGQNNLVTNQASFSNWNSGGNNNIGAIGKINYNLSFRNKKHYLENILLLGYGWIANKGQSTRKTEDAINLMTNYGYELGMNYYFSTGFQLISQFAPGFNYNNTPSPEYGDRISKFMAPGYMNVGLGFSYNPEENFQIIFRPANGKFTIVSDPFLQKSGKYGLERDGQRVRTELGAMLNIIYRLKIYKDMTLDNQLNFFSNYLYHSERIDIAYNGILNIKFNKFVSTIVSLDLVYDDDQIQKLQRKQTLGIGFSYNIGTKTDEKEKSNKIIKPFIVK